MTPIAYSFPMLTDAEMAWRRQRLLRTVPRSAPTGPCPSRPVPRVAALRQRLGLRLVRLGVVLARRIAPPAIPDLTPRAR